VRRACQVISLAFIAVGLYVASEARGMVLYTEIGPGGGFFPFWVGLILAGLSSIWFVQVSLQRKDGLGESFLPNATGAVRIVAIVASMFLFAFFTDTLGFSITMLIFLSFLLFVLGRQKPLTTALISVLGSFGIYYVFTTWLDVRLPVSSIEVLRNLGL
jgi:putative tricarboxylic transport membrane protein